MLLYPPNETSTRRLMRKYRIDVMAVNVAPFFFTDVSTVTFLAQMHNTALLYDEVPHKQVADIPS